MPSLLRTCQWIESGISSIKISKVKVETTLLPLPDFSSASLTFSHTTLPAHHGARTCSTMKKRWAPCWLTVLHFSMQRTRCQCAHLLRSEKTLPLACKLLGLYWLPSADNTRREQHSRVRKQVTSVRMEFSQGLLSNAKSSFVIIIS